MESEKIGQNQFYDIITSRKPDWHAIIYDLIHTEQLDPWDIDIVILTAKYFEKIAELEETDFYISSKVILAAALLLRIKSEFLLNKHIKSIDDILFGKKDEEKHVIERIEIDEDELPVLIPKTPLPRLRKVTLNELMTALDKAINTESRRIRREVNIKRARKLSEIDFPSFKRIDLKDRIREFYARVLTSLKKKAIRSDKHLNKVGYSDLAGSSKEEKLACFLPILHLSNNRKLWLEQEMHLDEIWIYLYDYFKKNKDNFIEELEEDIEDMKAELEEEKVENVNLDKKEGALEKARLKREEKKRLAEEVKKELEKELLREIKDIKKEQEIEDITGFGDE
jgi:segregation and condensation protein A